MKTFAYCSQSFGSLVRRVAGTPPTLCPPVTMETFEPAWLEGHDFVLFKLHGLKGQPYWYGDDFTTALSADQILQADLQGAVVFVANCWLFDHDAAPGPMLLPLLRTASAVIGGPGANYALSNQLGGADLLALYVRFFLQLRLSTETALRLAKIRLMLKQPDYVTRDTLEFTLFRATRQLSPAAHTLLATLSTTTQEET